MLTPVEQAIADVREAGSVLAASDPFGRAAVSPNGRVAFSAVRFAADPATIDTGTRGVAA